MINVTRHDPFGEVFDHLLRGGYVRPQVQEPGEAVRRMRIDVIEQDGVYKIFAELPGVRKDDIQVAVEGNQISVSAEVGAAPEAKEGERVLHSERYFGKFARTIRLSEEIDEEKASAKYAEGVLELMLPKKAAVGTRRITIQ